MIGGFIIQPHFLDSFEGWAIRLTDTITFYLADVTLKWAKEGKRGPNLFSAIGL
jgi:hypothetical protein